ncbi:MAG: presqualene diphosphate synthase HpnD [Gammaproteobacteria bacterium]|nr:presqualene diphosphate synthase HpnD [Gammaproteobacteria bacterium]
MTPEEYCQNKAAQSGSSFYYSFRFLPQPRRDAIIALYAYCREVDDVVDECSNIDIAKTKLSWWRDEVEKLYSGNPTHPVTKALAPHLDRFSLNKEYFLEILDGMEMDLEYDVYPTIKELSLYCYRVASAVGLLSIEIFGYEDRNTRKYAYELGMALQLTNIIRDVREDAIRGRVYLPQEDLTQFGVDMDELVKGQHSQKIVDLLRFEAERAREHYENAFRLLPEVDRYNQRSGLIMGEIYLALLNEIEHDGFRVLEHRVKLTPLRKLWLAWNSARREKQRHKRYQRQKAA